MHRSKVAHSLLPKITQEEDADILIISEQYANFKNGRWFEDESKTAAIWLPDIRQNIKKEGKGNGYTWLLLDNVIIISCYLTPSDNIDTFQAKLDSIEDLARTHCGYMIIAGNFNSRATDWGMPTTDSRGKREIHRLSGVQDVRVLFQMSPLLQRTC